MPTVRNGGQMAQRGSHTKQDIERASRDALARDDIRTAYAGEENEGPAHHPKEGHAHSTHYKARKRPKDSSRTPVR